MVKILLTFGALVRMAGTTRPNTQRDGVVAEIHVEPGASLAVDQAILELK